MSGRLERYSVWNIWLHRGLCRLGWHWGNARTKHVWGYRYRCWFQCAYCHRHLHEHETEYP